MVVVSRDDIPIAIAFERKTSFMSEYCRWTRLNVIMKSNFIL